MIAQLPETRAPAPQEPALDRSPVSFNVTRPLTFKSRRFETDALLTVSLEEAIELRLTTRASLVNPADLERIVAATLEQHAQAAWNSRASLMQIQNRVNKFRVW